MTLIFCSGKTSFLLNSEYLLPHCRNKITSICHHQLTRMYKFRFHSTNRVEAKNHVKKSRMKSIPTSSYFLITCLSIFLNKQEHEIRIRPFSNPFQHSFQEIKGKDDIKLFHKIISQVRKTKINKDMNRPTVSY